jgi:LysM repeat protein
MNTLILRELSNFSSPFSHALIRPLSIFIAKIITVIVLITLPNTAFATTGDSTKYLTGKDTLFMTLDDNSGEKIIEHKIVKGQTLYSLARFYGMNEEQLFPYNPSLKSNNVSIGQTIRVPIPNSAIKRFKGDNFKRWKYVPLLFIVKPKDNLYKIAKRVFHMPPDSVMSWNGLSGDVIAPGQRLLVGWVNINGVNDTARASAAVIKTPKVDVQKNELAEKFKKQKSTVETRGAAFWQIKGNPTTDYYCLHRTAKSGSIIAISNGVNGKTAYAKVIGKIPESAFSHEVVLIVAPSVAKILGAKDEKFFVKIKYVQ